MSTKTYDNTLGYMPEAKKPSIFARVSEYMSAVSAGLEAWREYERLRATGIEHSKAAAKAFEKHYE